MSRPGPEASGHGLQGAARLLFGALPDPRRVRIMVTLDQAAPHPDDLRALLEAGVNAVRVVTTFGEPATWQAALDAVRWAAVDAGRPCALVVALPDGRPHVRAVHWLGTLERRLHVREHLAIGLPPRSGPRPRAVVSATDARLAARLEVGAEVRIGSGRLRALVQSRREDGALLRVVAAVPDGEELHAGQLISGPGLEPDAAASSERGRSALALATREADAVELACPAPSADAASALAALRRLAPDRTPPPVVLRTESLEATRCAAELASATGPLRPTGILIDESQVARALGVVAAAALQARATEACHTAGIPVIARWLPTAAASGVAVADTTAVSPMPQPSCVLLPQRSDSLEAVRRLDAWLRHTAPASDRGV
ncbi:MAG TPA: hypothetical protein VKA00_01740 [Trueperaceae bacterium]|nr:hypothetical protein [Trueperaceae bacterium]